MTDVPPTLILNLRRMIRDCSDCDLRQNATLPVPWSGPLNPDIAVLGMAPGRTEDRLQEPFVGDAGVRLRTLLKGAGINPDECAYVNATNCLPPNDKVYDNHLAACRKWMRHQIAIINPRYLLVCGEVALKAVRETETWPKLTSLHGKPMWWPNPPAPAKPTLFVCVDDQTEALTSEGWKTHKELEDGDCIAEVDPWTMEAWFGPATFSRFDYDDELVQVEGRSISQWLTPNHRCLLETREGRWKGIFEAEELSPSSGRMYLPVSINLQVEKEEGIGESWASLLAWFLAEGGIPYEQYGVTVRIYQSIKTGHIPQIRQRLQEVGADWSERNPRGDEFVFAIHGHVARRLRNLAPNRRILPWLVNLPCNEIQAFLESFIDGDGHRNKKDGHVSIVQKGREAISVLQMMYLRLGIRSSVRSNNVGEMYTLHPTPNMKRVEVPKFRESSGGKNVSRGTPKGIFRKQYFGTVWCPSVSSGFWLARREGYPFVTGNSCHPAAALRQGRYHQAIVDDLTAFNEFRRTGQWIEECYVCGAELAGWDDKGWGIGLCERHCTRAGVLFDEEVGIRV